MRRVAALLKAVNVGGQGKLPMADLTSLVSDLGYQAPRTLLASGNVVFGADERAGEIEARLQAALAGRLGLSTQVLVRDGAEFEAIVAANPFQAMAADDPAHTLVMFLDGQPGEEAVAAVRSRIVGPEEIAAGPACVYLTYPATVGTSKLTGALIERLLGRRGTARNWNTVFKLIALTT